MTDKQAISKAKEVMRAKLGDHVSLDEIVEYLLCGNLLDMRRIRRAVIRHDYFKILEEKQLKHFETSIQISELYDVSENYIHETIYKQIDSCL